MPEFVSYFFQSEDYWRSIKHGSVGSAQGGFNATKLASLAIPIPSLPEQQRIVGVLDKAFAGIATAKAHAEQNRQNARAVFESHLESIFSQRGPGWVQKPLGDIATFRNGINFTKTSRGETVKIVGVKDFQQNFWAQFDDLDTVTTNGAIPDSDLLKEHDILFVRSNGNMQLIGRSLLVGNVVDRITHSGFTIRARLNDVGVAAKYLCHFLRSNSCRRTMIDGGIGTSIKSLNQTILSTLLIPVAPRAEQQRISGRLEVLTRETKRLESLYDQKLAALDELKKSLLHQAFSGQL